MHQEIKCGSIAPVLLVVVMAISRGLATAQSFSPQQETPLPASIAVPERSEDGQATLMPHGPVDGERSSPCSLHVANVIRQPSAEVGGATPTEMDLPYAPLSARCKFRLFLRTTYSPYTFASAAFQATEGQATDQWPHYGGGTQGWGKRLGATLATSIFSRAHREANALLSGMVCRDESSDYEERPRR